MFSRLSSPVLFAAVMVVATVSWSAPTWAERTIPFMIDGANHGRGMIYCTGPWGRRSACVSTEGHRNPTFYEAWDNALSANGPWECTFGYYKKYGENYCSFDARSPKFSVKFYLNENNAAVQLILTNGGQSDGSLSVNLPDKQGYALQTGTLDRQPAAASALAASAAAATKVAASGSDVDTYEFPARAGEKLAVRLDRDGAAGSAGSLVGLRVLDAGGGVIAQRRGKIPLEVEVTAPSAGIRIAVESVSGKDDQSFEGGYAIEVTPRSGQLGNRLTKPEANVEY